MLAHDTPSKLAAARGLHRAQRQANLFIKIPGTAKGLPAIKEAIFAGVPLNVTLLFSREQYAAAAAPSACCGPAPAPRIRASDTLYVEALAAP